MVFTLYKRSIREKCDIFSGKIFIGGSDFFPRDDGAGPAAGAAVPAGREGNPGDKLSLLVRHHFDHTVAAGFGAGTTVDTREIGGDLDHGVFLLGKLEDGGMAPAGRSGAAGAGGRRPPKPP